MTLPITSGATAVADTLRLALEGNDLDGLDALADATPQGDRDRFTTLLTIYALHTAPLESIGAAARHQHRPAVAALKQTCESTWLADLEQLPVDDADARTPEAVLAATRALAARDRLPAVYRWLARTAEWPDVVRFLTLEGGPDAGFDDL